MSRRTAFVVGQSPDTASKVILAITKGVATVVGLSRDRSIAPAAGQVIATHRAASAAYRAYQRGTNQREGFLVEGATFPASILKDARYSGGIVATWAEMSSKEERQKAAIAESRQARKLLSTIRKSGLVL